MKAKISLLITIFLLFISARQVFPCTVFTVSNATAVLVGNNEDYVDTQTKIWFVPAVDGKFGKVCFGFDYSYPQGGMNDQGLFFDWYASGQLRACPVLPGQMLPGDIKLEKTPSVDELISFYKSNANANDILLETCKTVDDALLFYTKYYEPSFGYAQLLVADKNGNSAVLTWDWDKNQKTITRKNGEYQVIGVGTEIIERELRKGEYEVTDLYFRMLLKDASINFTRYSNIYDLKNGTVEVFKMRDFRESIKFKLSDELGKGKANYSLESFFSERQNH